ncbi:MAG: carbohydrate ABC transporter permease [Clostridiales bacterium]|jgi:putative aldouronate transport system permease protein|nr:carbohydrate ABC transporter permease [Clostridiales bacterium]
MSVAHGKRSIGDRAFGIVNGAILFLLMVICIYPFYYIFIYSISDANAAATGLGVALMPVKMTLRNYQEVFKMEGMGKAAMVSALRTVIGTVGTVACSGFFAYLVTKPLYFKKTIYRLTIATMYFSSGLVPWYLTMRMYHLYNNFFVYFVPGLISAYYIILIKTFIEQLPASLEESAMLDGAGSVTIFTKIIFPLSMPIIATIAIFSAVGQWNTWFDNYILVQNKELTTLQLKLYTLLKNSSQLAEQANQTGANGGVMSHTEDLITPMAIRMTVTMVVTLPILFVYPFMQRYFVKGIMMGAIKG